MTVTTSATPPATGVAWEPHGHPVRWAVALVVGLLALSAFAIVTGAVTPDLRASLVSTTAGRQPGDAVIVEVQITSSRQWSVELRSLRARPIRGLRLVRAEPLPGVAGAGSRPPIRFDRGSPLHARLTYRLTECVVSHPALRVLATVRTRVGRTVTEQLLVIGTAQLATCRR